MSTHIPTTHTHANMKIEAPRPRRYTRFHAGTDNKHEHRTCACISRCNRLLSEAGLASGFAAASAFAALILSALGRANSATSYRTVTLAPVTASTVSCTGEYTVRTVVTESESDVAVPRVILPSTAMRIQRPSVVTLHGLVVSGTYSGFQVAPHNQTWIQPSPVTLHSRTTGTSVAALLPLSQPS